MCLCECVPARTCPSLYLFVCVSTWEITLHVSMHAHFIGVTNSCWEHMGVDLSLFSLYFVKALANFMVDSSRIWGYLNPLSCCWEEFTLHGNGNGDLC